MNYLQVKLEGSIILGLDFVEDYFQMETNKGGITFYNTTYYWNKGEKEEIERGFDRNKVIHKIIKKIRQKDKKYCRFILNDSSLIEISLRDESYFSPEAYNIYLNDGTMIAHQ